MHKLSEIWDIPGHSTKVSFLVSMTLCTLLVVSCDNEIQEPEGATNQVSADAEAPEAGMQTISSDQPDFNPPVNPSEQDVSEVTSSDVELEEVLLTGRFFDNAVQGLAYSTETQQGFTGPSGEFQFVAGEEIGFYIGDPFITGVAWKLGNAPAQNLMTPLDLAGAPWIDDQVTNMLRFLQSLDTDANTDNGIQLPLPEEHLPVGSLRVDFSEPMELFQQDSAVLDYISRSTGQRTSLIDTGQAIKHFQVVLNSQLSPPSDMWVLTDATKSEEVLDGMQASMTFFDDSRFSAAVIHSEIEIQVYGRYNHDELDFKVEFDRIQLVTDQQQYFSEIGDQNWLEVNIALNDLLPPQMKIAIGIDSILSILPDHLSMESADRSVQLLFGRAGEQVDDLAYLLIDPANLSMQSVGDQQQLHVTAHAIDSSVVGDIPLVWESSDNSVASVSSIGLVTANGAGEALVSVSSITTNISISVNVVVAESVFTTQCNSISDEQMQNSGIRENTSVVVQVNESDNPAGVGQVNSDTINQDGSDLSTCNE